MNHAAWKTALSTLLLASALFGCGEDAAAPSDAGTDAANDGTSEECPVVVSDDDCDESLRPIVFVHGTYGSGDNIANVALLFGSNGYCQDRFVAVEYNSLGGKPDAQLDALVDSIREKTGQDQVDLMGHSQGTGHCINYLSDATRAAKVANYVNLSGTGEVPNGVRTLSISSENDIGQMTRHAPNADEEVTFVDEDHFTLAASNDAFSAIYEFLIGEEPKYDEIQCGDEEITFEGLAEEFGDNKPVSTGVFEVYEIGSDAYERGEPVKVLKPDATGYSGAFKVKRLTAYEFKGLDENGDLVGHSYVAPQKRSNRLLRFLAPPTNPLVMITTTSNVKVGPNHSAIAFRSLRGAFRFDLGDSLKIDGKEILDEANAGRANMTVGLFASDQNENGMSDLGADFNAPFVYGTDVFIDASEPAFIDIDYNGTKLKIPNRKSSEGLMSVTLP